MANDVAYIAAAIFFPLVPAYILYRTLPSRTIVKGPFKGLQVHLTGAFAGYFLLVLVVFGFVHTRPKYAFEVYTVEGRVSLAGGETDDMTLSIRPPELTLDNNGKFHFTIPVRRDQVGDADFPLLVVEHPLYESTSVDLRPNHTIPLPPDEDYLVEYQRQTKVVAIKKPIPLVPKAGEPEFNPDKILPDAQK